MSDKYSRLLEKATNIDFNKPEENPEKHIIISNKKVLINRNNGRLRAINTKKNKKNFAEFIVNTICKQFFLCKWKKKCISMKYYTKGYNQQRANFKKFLNCVSNIYFKHKINYGEEIFNIIKKLPPNPNIIHDFNFGKIKFVNNEVLCDKTDKLIKLWAKIHFILNINVDLGEMLLLSIEEMNK